METPDSFDVEEPRTKAPPWLVDLTLLLGLAVIVLAVWLIGELRTDADGSAVPRGISASEARQTIDKELGAIKAFLPRTYGPLHTADAIFIDRITGETLSGPDELEQALARDAVTLSHLPVRTTALEVAHGDVAVYGMTAGLNTASERRAAGIVIVTFEGDKISREVVIPMEGVRATDDLLP